MQLFNNNDEPLCGLNNKDSCKEPGQENFTTSVLDNEQFIDDDEAGRTNSG